MDLGGVGTVDGDIQTQATVLYRQGWALLREEDYFRGHREALGRVHCDCHLEEVPHQRKGHRSLDWRSGSVLAAAVGAVVVGGVLAVLGSWVQCCSSWATAMDVGREYDDVVLGTVSSAPGGDSIASVVVVV